MHTGTMTLFRVRGIPVRAHWSLLLALAYIAVAFSGNVAKMAHLANVPVERLSLPALLWGAIVAVGLFASVLLHELAHSLVAVRAGGRVREITLMIVGGVSKMEKMPPSLSQEGWMALVGPLASLAISGVLWLGPAFVPNAGEWADLRLGLFYLASLNLTLALFNLLPAFPMDGGRVFRALLGRRLGRARATQIAAGVGKLMAVLFGVLGIVGGNVLLIIIAFFLFGGANAEASAEEVHALLGDLKVREVMTPRPLMVRLDLPLSEVGAELREAGRQEAIVLDERNAPLGVLRAQDFAHASDSAARVGDLRHLFAGRASEIGPDAPAEGSLLLALEQGARYLVVRDPAVSPAVLGLIGPTEIQTALALRGLAGKGSAPGARATLAAAR